MTLGELALVALQCISFVAVGWSVSALVVARVFAGSEVAWPERLLFAIAGGAFVAIVLMVAHVATGGTVFANPIVVPVVGAGAIAWASARGAWRVEVPLKHALAALLLLFALFVIPMFVAGSSVREGDPPWHMGWTHELLDGQPLPDGHAPEFGRNAYPWGWHAILATTTRLVPGSTPLLAHEALHVVLVATIPLAAACLARRLRRDAGWYAAAAVALIAGSGWISALGPDFVASPTEARHGADMVVASPNSVYELMPPALPREMGLVLLAAAGTGLLLALPTGRTVGWVVGGIVAGCAGLVSFPMLIPATMWITIAALFAPARRVRTWLAAAVPTFSLFALWLAPVAYWYLTEGGFVDVVPVLGVEWPLVVALASWGVLLPLALAGVWLAARRRSLETKVVLGFAAAAVASLGLAIARRGFGWGLGGNETLLHQGRMWPVAHLLGAAFAGLALAHLNDLLRRSGRRLASGVTAAVVAFGSISLLLSIPALAGLIADREEGFVYADEDVAAGSFVREAAGHLSSEDVVLSENVDLGFKLFEFSGVSLAAHDDPRLIGNEARIRYRDLAERYVERRERDGFVPTHVVVEEGTETAGEVLVAGEYEGRRWALVEVAAPGL